jgi:hypothetical protein
MSKNTQDMNTEWKETNRRPTSLRDVHHGRVGEKRGRLNVLSVKKVPRPRCRLRDRNVGEPSMDIGHLTLSEKSQNTK